MADVYTFINSTGTITTDASEILAQVSAEYQATFGTNLVVPDTLTPQGATTPQGLLIVSEALARIAVADNNAALANQINPNLAGGVYLDAILALTGIQRDPATFSTIFATFTGVVGTSIAAGSQASTSSGNIFATTVINTIPPGGTLSNVIMQAVDPGSIACGINDLTVGNGGYIISSVLGWETISANTSAVLGMATQSDIAARDYRLTTLAAQGSSVAQAIVSGVAQVPGVTSMTFLENTASTTQTIDETSMVSHSIYLCVNGGGLGTSTTVIGTVTGTPTTIVTSGSQASSNGYIFQTTESVTIPGGGSITVPFVALQTGSIPCPVGTLNTIVTPISGWASVTNLTAGTIGTESTVAQALVSKKSAGAGYNNGNGTPISTVVTVPYSNQLMTVLFDTPTAVPINVIINVIVNTPVQNPYTAVQNAILNYANGEINGESGLTVGQNVSSFELSGAVTTTYPGIYVQSCHIAVNPTKPTSSDEISIAVYEIATISMANIVVNVQ